MSINLSSQKLQQALETIHLFAETPHEPSTVVTANLEVINRWGRVRKIFMYWFIGGYLNQLQPKKSIKEFKCRLATILTSDSYDSNLARTCAKACRTFNRLIKTTNLELAAAQQSPEADLIVDLKAEEQRCAQQEKIPANVNGGAIIRGPGKELTREEYDQLLGPSIVQDSPKSSVKESIQGARPHIHDQALTIPQSDDHLFPHLPLIPKPHFTALDSPPSQGAVIQDPTLGTTLADSVQYKNTQGAFIPVEVIQAGHREVFIMPTRILQRDVHFPEEMPIREDLNATSPPINRSGLISPPPSAALESESTESSISPETRFASPTFDVMSKRSPKSDAHSGLQQDPLAAPSISSPRLPEAAETLPPEAPVEETSALDPHLTSLPEKPVLPPINAELSPETTPEIHVTVRRRKNWRAELPSFQMTLRAKSTDEKK